VTEEQSREHVERFNAAVRSGDWPSFVTGFAPDAVMAFEGPPVGPYVGIDAIADGYATRPPTDTMEIVAIHPADDADVVRFRWSAGGSGSMTIVRRPDGLIRHLAVIFDPAD
jgi:steroid delta-isomerase